MTNKHSAVLPSQVLQDIEAWSHDCELSKLVFRLRRSSDEQLFDIYSEIMVARHLQSHKCGLRVEVSTPCGRSADFEAIREGLTFYVHVKRLGMDGTTRQQIRISSRTRSLEKINRPFVVSLSFLRALSNTEMEDFVKQAKTFLEQGSIGDRRAFKNQDGVVTGECEIHCEWKGNHVTRIVCPPMSSSDAFKRCYRQLREAYHQFMPGAVNVILLTGGWGEELEDLEAALIGPERASVLADGTVVNLERLPNGFWSRKKHPASEVAGWFSISSNLETLRFNMWHRNDTSLSPAMLELLSEVLP